MTEEVLRKGNRPEAVVHLERDSENRADITSKDRHVIIGVLPYVKITKQNRGCKFSKKVQIQAQRGWQAAQQEAEEKWWKRFCCLVVKFRSSGCRAAEIQVDFRKGTKFLGPKRSVHFSKGTLRDVKIRKRKDP